MTTGGPGGGGAVTAAALVWEEKWTTVGGLRIFNTRPGGGGSGLTDGIPGLGGGGRGGAGPERFLTIII